MRNKDLRDRTKRFAIEIIKLAESLPRTRIADVLGGQILRSGTSVGANYRSLSAERGQKLILFQRWASLKKKPMKHFIG
ncbi:MAG: four helix bundle protein [Candidatus Edwardsbacteria bacterium]